MSNVADEPAAPERKASIATRCWEYDGYRNKKGYGHKSRRVNGKTVTEFVHRMAYEVLVGPIPPGMCVLHACDNPPCYNPAHLFLGTRADNNRDRQAKGRTRTANEAKTHCPQGHEFTPDNTRIYGGRRHCRQCNQARMRERYRRYGR